MSFWTVREPILQDRGVAAAVLAICLCRVSEEIVSGFTNLRRPREDVLG